MIIRHILILLLHIFFKVGDTAVSAAQDRGHDALALQIARCDQFDNNNDSDDNDNNNVMTMTIITVIMMVTMVVTMTMIFIRWGSGGERSVLCGAAQAELLLQRASTRY